MRCGALWFCTGPRRRYARGNKSAPLVEWPGDLAPVIAALRAAGKTSLRAIAAGLNERSIRGPWRPSGRVRLWKNRFDTETVRHFEQMRLNQQRFISSPRGVSSACGSGVGKWDSETLPQGRINELRLVRSRPDREGRCLCCLNNLNELIRYTRQWDKPSQRGGTPA